MTIIPKNIRYSDSLHQFFRRYSKQIIVSYFITILLCLLIFNSFIPITIFFIGLFSVMLFFKGCERFGCECTNYSEKTFIKKIFLYSFLIRFFFSIFNIIYNYSHYGTYYESNIGDIYFYVPEAVVSASRYGFDLFGSIKCFFRTGTDLSDIGYVLYLSILFKLMGVDSNTNLYPDDPSMLGHEYIWLPILLKSIFGALTCVYIYKISNRHFGEQVGKYSAIFCMLQFNLIWWCSSMMKETEMTFLYTFFAYKADELLLGNNKKISSWVGVVIVGVVLFGFRTVLAVISFVSFFAALLFTSSKVISTSKKIIAGVFVALMLLVVVGDKVLEESKSLVEIASNTEYQQRNMIARSNSKNGNQFAKYVSAAVFAPLIFTIPFPSMVYINQDQEMQNMVNGGNYIKNLLSFFTIYAMFFLLFSGEWRKHVLVVALLVGYLASLTLSVFAQSGRFHMPIIPLEMMFAAYGFSLVIQKKKMHWFNYVLILEFIFCIAWAWFKLKGRDMI